MASLDRPIRRAVAAGRLIVCERDAYWGPAWRRELAGGNVRVCETRLWDEARTELARWRWAALAVEFRKETAERMAADLAELLRSTSGVVAVAMARRGLEAAEWLAREAGAACLTTSPRQLRPAAQLVRRHGDLAPPMKMSWKEQIWTRLPWGE